jgi:hypothetical protein
MDVTYDMVLWGSPEARLALFLAIFPTSVTTPEEDRQCSRVGVVPKGDPKVNRSHFEAP